MARIPDDELQRIKSQVKVAELCREYGIELKQMGPDNLRRRKGETHRYYRASSVAKDDSREDLSVKLA